MKLDIQVVRYVLANHKQIGGFKMIYMNSLLIALRRSIEPCVKTGELLQRYVLDEACSTFLSLHIVYLSE